LGNIANAKTTADSSVSTATQEKTVSIRVSPNSYLVAFLLGMFFTAFFIYLEKDLWAAVLLALMVFILPALALTDRVVFDGKRLRRTGILPRVWAYLNGYYYHLKLSDM
jgi:hypothetical protein